MMFVDQCGYFLLGALLIFTAIVVALILGGIMDLVRAIADRGKEPRDGAQHSLHTGPAQIEEYKADKDQAVTYPALLVEQNRKGRVVAVTFNGHRLPFGLVARTDEESRDHERWYKTHGIAIATIRAVKFRLFGE